MIDQRTDPVSRLVRATTPMLRALGGDPSGITPEIAEDLLALLDLAEAEIAADATPPIRTLWDPVLTEEEIDNVMPADAAVRVRPASRVTASVPAIAPLPRWRGAAKHEPIQPLRAVAGQ